MSSRNEIYQEINQYRTVGQDIVRKKYLKELNDYTKNDTIIYFSSFNSSIPGIPSDLLSINFSDIQGFMSCLNGCHGDTLDLILHSPGGSLEAAEQIVNYLRSKYTYIRAIIPQNAMSAATMIACACDEIILGKHSAIGPIDPQMTITMDNGIRTTIPAHSILADFEKAEQEILTNPNLAPLWVPKIMSIPHGFLDWCQKTIELSRTKVAEWLNTYMFKNDNDKKGEEIAEWLADFSEHRTHGRPINYDLALSKGLKVKRLENDQNLQEKVLNVYHATTATFEVTQCIKIIENHMGKGSYCIINFQPLPQILLPQIQPQPQPQPQSDQPF